MHEYLLIFFRFLFYLILHIFMHVKNSFFFFFLKVIRIIKYTLYFISLNSLGSNINNFEFPLK